MSLINKIFHDEEPTMSNHACSAILRLYFVGETTRPQTITDLETILTRQQGGSAYTLGPLEKNQIDEWKAHYDGLPNTNQQQFWLLNLESTMILAEYGPGVILTKPKFKTINGLTTN